MSIKAALLEAPGDALPDLEHLRGGAAWLHPHGRDLRSRRSPGLRLRDSGVGRIDEDADDGRPELLRWVEDDERPETNDHQHQGDRVSVPTLASR